MFESQKTQQFWFQISFSYLVITPAFFDEKAIPAPVLKSTLQCGSNGILHKPLRWKTKEILSKMSEVTCYTLLTVSALTQSTYKIDKQNKFISIISIEDFWNVNCNKSIFPQKVINQLFCRIIWILLHKFHVILSCFPLILLSFSFGSTTTKKIN